MLRNGKVTETASQYPSHVILCVLIIYHCILAYLYGGELLDSVFPDPWAYTSTGLYLVGQDSAVYVNDLPIVLPLFAGFLYLLLGFPSFLFYLWLWGAITMVALILGTYISVRYSLDHRTALVASALVALNWNLGWIGQELLTDVGSVAFALLSLGLLFQYLHSGKRLVLIASGLLLALSIWTKFSSLYAYVPVVSLVAFQKLNSKQKRLCWFSSLVAGQFPFLFILYSRFGDPFFPIRNLLTRTYGGAVAHVSLNPTSVYIEWLPDSLGYPALFFLVCGLVFMVSERKLLFPVWSTYLLLVYSLLVTPPVYFQYVTHFSPILLVCSSFAIVSLSRSLLSSKHKLLGSFAAGSITLASLALTNSHFKLQNKTVYYKILGFHLFRSRLVLRFLHQKMEIVPLWVRYYPRYLSLQGKLTPEMVKGAPYAINCSYSILLVARNPCPLLKYLVGGGFILLCFILLVRALRKRREESRESC